MVRLSARLRLRAHALHRWFFPEPIPLPAGLRRLLAAVYPRLDVRRIHFHRGMPHLLKLIPNQAITLPAVLSPRTGRVYVRPDAWRPETVPGLGLIVHEAFHLLQLQEAGAGLGLARPFIVLYLACAAANRFRYAGHPMESDAYHLAGRSRSRFEATVDPALLDALRAHDDLDGLDALDELDEHCGCFVTPSSGLAFWRRLAASAPGFAALSRAGARLARGASLPVALACRLLALLSGTVWLLLWSLATLVLGLAKLAVEAAGAGAAAGLALLAAVVSWCEPPAR